jgi:hypothetical protein
MNHNPTSPPLNLRGGRGEVKEGREEGTIPPFGKERLGGILQIDIVIILRLLIR